MRYIIFSDSHGMSGNMRTAIKRNLVPGAGLDGMLFCGDGFDGAKLVAKDFDIPFIGIHGNCDQSSVPGKSDPAEVLAKLAGHKILLIHGHRHYVTDSTDFAENRARKAGAEVLLFGHTHIRYERYVNNLYIFNPGSIALPRDGRPSFGILEFRGNDILLSHGTI